MSDTSARLLGLLSLLQTPREWSGGELAGRLGVSLRTIRRDIDRLRDLGYPVQATLGSLGGYRLVAGKALPPLLLEDDEAVAIAVGLGTAARQAIEGIDDASIRALAKLQQVLPSRLRQRVDTISRAAVPLMEWEKPTVDPQRLTLLASAAVGDERVRFVYRHEERLVEPHGLVSAGRRWYLVGFDNHRHDWRVFRVDRMSDLASTGRRVPPRKLPSRDAAAFVAERLYDLTPVFEAVVTLMTPAEKVKDRAPGTVEPIDEHSCRWRAGADTIPFLARQLFALDCDFEVHEPQALIDHLSKLEARIAKSRRARRR